MITDEAYKDENEVKECYLTDEGAKVFLPIAQHDFLQSIKLQSISFILTKTKKIRWLSCI